MKEDTLKLECSTMATKGVDLVKEPSKSNIMAPCRTMNAFIVFDDHLKAGTEVHSGSMCSSLTAGSELEELEVASQYRTTKSCRVLKEKRKKKSREKKKKKDRKSVSYAQLFFDPATKMLVTLMEVSAPQDSSILPKQRELGTSNFQGRETGREIEICGNVFPTAEESRFQDQTLLTECTSVSSEVGAREGPEFHSTAGSKTRFSSEPVVFSHRGSSQLWIEESDVNLYLLHNSADPWDVSMRKSIGCTETLRKLLNIRSCISLATIRSGNESKWRSTCDPRKEANGDIFLRTMDYAALSES